MRVKILGKYWNLKFSPNLSTKGHCDAPTIPRKRMLISSTLRGKALLAALLHETHHAADWNKDEEWVQEVSDDQAEIIMKHLERITDG